jgi:hypothetical protein
MARELGESEEAVDFNTEDTEDAEDLEEMPFLDPQTPG